MKGVHEMIIKDVSSSMKISDYIQNETVLFVNEKKKHNVIDTLIAQAGACGFVNDMTTFKRAIVEREAKLSTGIGNGIAIPHAKIEGIDQFFVLIAVLDSGVDWEAIDQKPVSLVFLIGGPNSKQADYLQLLSQLMVFVKKETVREAIHSAKSTDAIVTLFAN